MQNNQVEKAQFIYARIAGFLYLFLIVTYMAGVLTLPGMTGSGDFAEVSGKIIANLFASTSGTDSDWIVKLIDVYPEKYEPDPKMGGYQLMIAGDVLRGRYYKSWEKPEALPANQVVHYKIPFPANDHVFQKGHRIMVQVQSTWFPVIDRNPQRFVPNIFLAKESDFQPATQRVFRSGQQASHIAVPVVQSAR